MTSEDVLGQRKKYGQLFDNWPFAEKRVVICDESTCVTA